MKETPIIFDITEPAFMLKLQDMMCNETQEINNCMYLKCKDCILNADLPEFSDWLINQLKKSGERK